MAEAYIIDAVRTPVGKRGGGLAGVHSADLGAHVIKGLTQRTDFDPGAVEDVIFGCCDTIGSQAGDIARTCWLAAGLPDHVPGVTIDRQCGSSQQSVHFAAQAVMSGTSDLIVAGGVQNMSQIPISSSMTCAEDLGFVDPFSGSKGWVERYGTQEVSQFRGAEMIAEKWDVSRKDMEEFALESHRRAIRAIDEGRFDNEIVAYGEVATDEGPRRDTTLEKMARLQPLEEGGRLTAAVASQLSDGASCMLVASERAVKEHGLTPRARVHHISVRGDQGGDVAAPNLEGDVVDRRQPAEAHGEMLDLEQRVGLPRPHARPSLTNVPDMLLASPRVIEGLRVDTSPRGRQTMMATMARPNSSMR